jgi:DNA-binding NtrC family response regulator
VTFYVEQFNVEFRKKITGVTKSALSALTGYAWPGNVRELRNAVERAMLLAESAELDESHFPMLTAVDPELSSGMGLPAGGLNLEALERSLVVQALERAGWNQTKAATLLGLNRDQIRYRIEKFGLEKPQ